MTTGQWKSWQREETQEKAGMWKIFLLQSQVLAFLYWNITLSVNSENGVIQVESICWVDNCNFHVLTKVWTMDNYNHSCWKNEIFETLLVHCLLELLNTPSDALRIWKKVFRIMKYISTCCCFDVLLICILYRDRSKSQPLDLFLVSLSLPLC